MKLSEYMNLVQEAFSNNGNLEGQRSVISKSSVATKIRSRMSEDFKNGAIFPQVVIGLLVNEESFEKFHKLNTYGEEKDFTDLYRRNHSIYFKKRGFVSGTVGF